MQRVKKRPEKSPFQTPARYRTRGGCESENDVYAKRIRKEACRACG